MSDIKKPATPSSAAESLAESIAITKAKLEAEPKVLWTIGLDPGEPKNTCDFVTINGHKTVVPKGKTVEVPKSVANILREKYNINATIGEDVRIDRAKDVQDALN